MTINVLGTKYEVIFGNERDYPNLKECDGYIDNTVKKIIVTDCSDFDETCIKDKKVFKQKVLRHEIIHAYLFESGLHCDSEKSETWATNEEMVDWLAIQIPKITITRNQANCL